MAVELVLVVEEVPLSYKYKRHPKLNGISIGFISTTVCHLFDLLTEMYSHTSGMKSD